MKQNKDKERFKKYCRGSFGDFEQEWIFYVGRSLFYSLFIYNWLLRFSTARGSGTGLFIGGPTKVKARRQR